MKDTSRQLWRTAHRAYPQRFSRYVSIDSSIEVIIWSPVVCESLLYFSGALAVKNTIYFICFKKKKFQPYH